MALETRSNGHGATVSLFGRVKGHNKGREGLLARPALSLNWIGCLLASSDRKRLDILDFPERFGLEVVLLHFAFQ